MSYRVCGYCKNSGHNVSTCRDLRRDVAAKVPKALAYPVSASSRVNRIKKNMVANGSLTANHVTPPKIVNVRDNEGHGRVCSYCSQRGHNVRRCQSKQNVEKMQKARPVISSIRKAFIEYCKTTGFGVGSLIKVPETQMNSWFTDRQGSMLMVVGFHINKIGVGSYPYATTLRVKGTKGKEIDASLPTVVASYIVEKIRTATTSYYTLEANDGMGMEVVKNPTKSFLPEEMWDNDWVEVKGKHAEEVKQHL